MKYSIVYSKEGGNTNLLANSIKDHLNANDCVYFGLPSQKALEADVIFVGFWTDQGRCDSVCAKFLKEIKSGKIFLFGSAGFGISQEYFDEIIKRSLENLTQNVSLIGSFMCQGKMKPSVKERYLKIKAENPTMPKIDLLIQNFDEALKHPNQKDIDNLLKAIDSIF